MKIVSYNIQYCTGFDDRVDVDRVAREIEGADIVALQEVDRFWSRTGDVDQAVALAERLPDHRWVFSPAFDVDASYRDEAGKLVNRRRQHGDMVLSRFPILSSRSFPLPKAASVTRHSIQKAVIETVIGLPGGPLRFYNTHLFYWAPRVAEEQVRFILERVDRAVSEGGAWCGGDMVDDEWRNGEPAPPMPADAIIAGDMNSPPGSPVYEAFVGPPQMGGGRMHTVDRFVDPWTWLGNDEDSGRTSRFADARIDHIFVGTPLRDRIVDMRIDVEATGSDHFPVWLELADS